MRDTPEDLDSQVATALREDVGTGDVTAEPVPATQKVRGRVITREDAVLAADRGSTRPSANWTPVSGSPGTPPMVTAITRQQRDLRDRGTGTRGAHR